MIGLALATALAAGAGMVCRVEGNRLMFYAGDIERGSTMLDAIDGYPLVSRHAVEKICRASSRESNLEDVRP